MNTRINKNTIEQLISIAILKLSNAKKVSEYPKKFKGKYRTYLVERLPFTTRRGHVIEPSSDYEFNTAAIQRSTFLLLSLKPINEHNRLHLNEQEISNIFRLLDIISELYPEYPKSQVIDNLVTEINRNLYLLDNNKYFSSVGRPVQNKKRKETLVRKELNKILNKIKEEYPWSLI